MATTPLQALQLIRGIESPTFYPSARNEANNAFGIGVDAGEWTTMVGEWEKVIAAATSDSGYRPVIYLSRRPIVNESVQNLDGELEGAELADAQRRAFLWPKSFRGAVLIYVESFEPALGNVSGGKDLYWEVGTNPIPELKVARTSRSLSQVVRVRHVVRRGTGGDYQTPMNAPGEWEAWQPVEVPETDGVPGPEADLYQGDALFAVNAELTMRIDNAHVVNVWMAGFDLELEDTCGGRPC